MKTTFFFTLLLVLLSAPFSSVSGQESRMFAEIQQAKESNIDFPRVANLLPKTSGEENIRANFINSGDVHFFQYSSSVLKNTPAAFTLAIPVNDTELQLELLEVRDDFNYEVKTSDGNAFEPNLNFKHYRGVVKDNPSSIVDLTCFDNEIMGLICTDESNYNLTLDAQSGKHLLFNDKALK